MFLYSPITVAWLEESLACEDQVNLFRATFDESALLTRANLKRAAAAGLDLEWLVKHYLDNSAAVLCDPSVEAAWEKYLAAADEQAEIAVVAVKGPLARYKAGLAKARQVRDAALASLAAVARDTATTAIEIAAREAGALKVYSVAAIEHRRLYDRDTVKPWRIYNEIRSALCREYMAVVAGRLADVLGLPADEG